MVKPKRQSKRVPLARKYHINKKAKEHERKQRRDAKKNPKLRKKLHKDPGIPNLNPFKAQILQRLQETSKLLKFSEKQRQRRASEIALRRRLGGDSELAGLAADAAARGDAYVQADGTTDGTQAVSMDGRAGESTRRAFYRHIKTIMEKADIILEVLDARDPLGCRAPAIEALAQSQSPPKRLVLVLNKIDLVPPQVVRDWLSYLRKELPTVAFKASTQHQRSHLSAPSGGAINKATESGDVLTGSGAAGADTLLQLIKNYSRSHDMKRAVTVGIVGYPNVGKSSVINSLKRSRAVGVSSTPGFTRVIQEVSLDAKVTLLDSPGIIFDDEPTGNSLLLKNCVSVDSMEDPEAAVDGIVTRCAREKLVSIYGIPLYTSTEEFLTHVAIKRGKLGKGGVVDRVTAARTVLQDWNSGKIPFYVSLPSRDADVAMTPSEPTNSDVGASAIVPEWSTEFDLGSLLAEENRLLSSVKASSPAEYVPIRGSTSPRVAKSNDSRLRDLKAAIEKATEATSDSESDDDDDHDMDGN